MRTIKRTLAMLFFVNSMALAKHDRQYLRVSPDAKHNERPEFITKVKKMAAMQEKKFQTSKDAVTLDKYKDSRHLQEDVESTEASGNWEDDLPEGVYMSIEDLAQGELETARGIYGIASSTFQWTQSLLSMYQEVNDSNMTALYTSVDFNITGDFQDGNFFQSYVAYEDPENPGMTIGASCQVEYQKERDFVQYDGVQINNYYANETESFKVEGNFGLEGDTMNMPGQTWDNTGSVMGWHEDEMNREQYSTSDSSMRCVMQSVMYLLSEVAGVQVEPDPELNPSYERAIKEGFSYQGWWGWRLFSDAFTVADGADGSDFTFAPVDILDRLPASPRTEEAEEGTTVEDTTEENATDRPVTDYEAEMEAIMSDPYYWTANSNITNFTYEGFLLKHNTTNLNMTVVNMTSLNFTDFNLTSWLDSYNLTARFNFWLELLGDNTDVYDTNDFNLTEYIAKDHGMGLHEYKEFIPFDSLAESLNITQMLAYIALDLATDGAMEITFNSLVHEAYSDFDLELWLLEYNTTAINLNSTRPIFVRYFDFSSFNLANVLNHGGRMDMTEPFVEELNNPDYDLSSFNLQEMLNATYGDEPMNDIRDWEIGTMFQSMINHINANANSVSADDWFNDFVIEYNDCYWYDEGCTEEEERFYQCYWYDIGCPAWSEEPGDFDAWVECIYDQVNKYGQINDFCSELDPSEAYYDCLMDREDCQEELHHHCIWYKHQCPIDGEGGEYEDFDEWLECYTDVNTIECGPWASEHFSCYWDGIGCSDAEWHDCYWQGLCGDEPTTGGDQGFEHWLDCWENTTSYCFDEDPTGEYDECYDNGSGCEDPLWYDCYFDGKCDEDTSSQDINSFDEWLECYEESNSECGENHSAYHDCYWSDEGCQDPYWHDCFWYNEGCDKMIDFEDDMSEEYINGYFEGYMSGYTDGVVDTVGPAPEPLDPFLQEMIIASFDDWVEEQEQRAGRFFCGQDIRLDFPFDDTEYMALWASHNCADWDLYLTIVADDEIETHALAQVGANLSLRRGCYNPFEGVLACEFYIPHGTENKFGILFQGGFHAIWYEHEWEYNSQSEYNSWVGDW